MCNSIQKEPHTFPQSFYPSKQINQTAAAKRTANSKETRPYYNLTKPQSIHTLTKTRNHGGRGLVPSSVKFTNMSLRWEEIYAISQDECLLAIFISLSKVQIQLFKCYQNAHESPQCSQQLTIAARIIEVAGDADMGRKLQQLLSTLHL